MKAFGIKQQRGWGRHLPALALFLAVYVLLTWPLALHVMDSIPAGFKGDGWEEVQQFWWYKHTVVDGGGSPFFDPKLFYPSGWNTVTGSHSPTLMLPTIPFTLLLGPVGAFNVLMMLGFLFAAVGAYLLVLRLTRDRLAGALAGVAYAFCMSRLLRIGGHFNTQTGSAWIPWVFFCLEMARSRNGRSRRLWFVAAGLCYAGSVLSYFYFVYIIAIPVAAYLLVMLWQERHDRAALRQDVISVVLMFGAAAVLVAPFAFWALLARNAVGVPAYTLAYTAPLGISIDRLFIPNRYHPVWGEWFRARFPDVGEQSFIFLGLTVTALALIGLVKRSHQRNGVYLVVALVSLVVGMGPVLYWNHAPTGVPLLGGLFFRFVPMFDVIRVWSRFSLVTTFAIAVLAGLTAAYLRPRLRGGTLVVVALLGLATFELLGHPFFLVSEPQMVREVDEWLLALPADTPIIELPLSERFNGGLNYSRQLHDLPVATGYATAMPQSFLAQVNHFNTFPNQETVDVLQRWQVRYLLYTTQDSGAFDAEMAPAIDQLQRLQFISAFAGHPGERVYVYEIGGPPAGE